MKKYRNLVLCLSVALLTFSSSFAQSTVYSTIAKNMNSDAKSLKHDLNTVGDTLQLNSDFDLFKVEFISEKGSKVFNTQVSKGMSYIPLESVPIGDYTIAAYQILSSDDVYQYQKTIIFRLSRVLPINDGIAEVRSESVQPLQVNSDLVASSLAINGTDSDMQDLVSSLIENDIIIEERTNIIADNNLERKKHARGKLKSYNLTDASSRRYAVQSREDYRANNLRPNGKPYD
ncbi:hypothetical protein [Oceanihabitans sediminis]|nr:hypothetical protein [Oceanihabitans sediminis]MDX1774740.1 hypothetical protein [Oceanihabitans sediminis]